MIPIPSYQWHNTLAILVKMTSIIWQDSESLQVYLRGDIVQEDEE